jgi:hypothetical protein
MPRFESLMTTSQEIFKLRQKTHIRPIAFGQILHTSYGLPEGEPSPTKPSAKLYFLYHTKYVIMDSAAQNVKDL